MSKSAASKIKHTAGLNAHGERLKLIDIKNDCTDFTLCNEKETSDHVMLCDNIRKMRDYWIAIENLKFKPITKKRKGTRYENKILE